MKLKFKALAAAAVMVVAGQASAALSDTFVTDGTLFLTVWDVTTNKSYVRDLGTSINSFLPGPTLTSNAGANVVFGNLTGSTLFSSTFAGANAANIRWTVVGADGIEGEGAGNGSRFVSAFNSTLGTIVNGSVRGYAGTAINFAGELLQNSGVDFSGAPAEYATTGLNSVTGGGPGWAPAIAGVGLGSAIISGFNAALFYLGATSNDTSSNDPGNAAPNVRYGNSSQFATLTLDTSGVVTYNLAAAQVAAVPLPAAVWLMGAGLMALGGAARRRKAANA